MQGAAGAHGFDVLAVWSRRKWLVMGVFVLMAPMGVTVALSLPDLYAATATVIVEQPAASTEMETRLQLIRQEILSRSRVEGLIRTLDLYPTIRERYSMEAAIDRMRKDVRIDSKLQPQPSGIGSTISFAITFRGVNPDVAAKVANAVASAYLEEDLKLRGRRTSGATLLLKAQLDGVKQNMVEHEQAAAAFQEQHSGELPQQAEATRATLNRLQADLRTAADERIRAVDRRNELMKELASATDAGGPVGAGPTSDAARLARKKVELAELSRRYSDKYPDVIRLKEEVAELEAGAAASAPAATLAGGDTGRSMAWLRGAVRDAESDIIRLKGEETRIKGDIAEHIGHLENAPRWQRDYLQIARDYQVTSELYESLRKRYEQAMLEEADHGPDSSPFRILESATAPTGPAAPNRLMLLFMALAGALALAAAAGAGAELLDTSFHSTDDVRSFTRVPVVATIPRIVTPRDRSARRRRLGLAAVSLLVGTAAVVHTVHRVSQTKDGLALMLSKSRP